jgi:predicted nucleic acid-binding protein
LCALLDEVTEKLLASGIEAELVSELLTLLVALSESIEVPAESVLPVVLNDPDDDPILACAVLGKADYLVTYDAHFESLRVEHSEIKIVKALPFLWALRGDRPPDP